MKAFPGPTLTMDEEGNMRGHFSPGGMDLRDYFAAAALTGTLASSVTSRDGEAAVKSCYRFADAMLKERNK